jgi:DNA-binding CsgD family transcriptional regulator
MSNFTIAARAKNRIRHLASLDISGSLLAPMILEEVEALVPLSVGVYVGFADGGSFCSNDADTNKVLPAYLRDFSEQREREVLRPLSEAIRCEFEPTPMSAQIRSTRADFLRHDLYNVVFRPVGIHDGARLITRTAQNSPLGALMIQRRCSRKSLYTYENLRPLAQMQHWVSHALEPRPQLPTVEFDTSESAVLTIGGNLSLKEMSPNAQRLMQLAFGHRWFYQQNLPDGLYNMLRSLQKLNQADMQARPTLLKVESFAGRFSFRAHILGAKPENISEHIGARTNAQDFCIVITHEMPRTLRLLKAVRNSDLPQRQGEVCYWLARGDTHGQIAERFGISVNTAIYHSRQIYAEFGVNNRKELYERLLASTTILH